MSEIEVEPELNVPSLGRLAHLVHAHDFQYARQCRRLWLKVLEQTAAEAVGDERALADLATVRNRRKAQRQAVEYLRAVTPDLVELGALLSLRRDQVEDLTQLGPEQLLRNLRSYKGV